MPFYHLLFPHAGLGACAASLVTGLQSSMNTVAVAETKTTDPFTPAALEEAARAGGAIPIIRRFDGYTYFRHRDTGMVYALPFPTEKSLADYYDGFLFQQPASSSFRAMRIEIADATAKITEELVHRYGARTGSLLDFGGGLGFYADGFSAHFHKVALYDVDPKACHYAAEAFPGAFSILRGQPGDDVPTDERYDVVFVSHVIEHYVDLPAFFRTLKKLVKPDGLIVIATPNNHTWEHFARPHLILHYIRRTIGRQLTRAPMATIRLASDSWLSCDPPRHIYAFNDRALCAVAERGGFAVQSVFTEYAWNSRYARIHEQTSPVGHGRMKRMALVALNAYARPMLSLLARLDSNKDKGGNLVLIARANERAEPRFEVANANASSDRLRKLGVP